MKKVSVGEYAFRDMLEIAAFIAKDSPKSAARFLQAAHRGIRAIGDFPSSGLPLSSNAPHLRGLRCGVIPGFPSHWIYYVARDKPVRILRILNATCDVGRLFDLEVDPSPEDD